MTIEGGTDVPPVQTYDRPEAGPTGPTGFGNG
jgi:hypothetical protein